MTKPTLADLELLQAVVAHRSFRQAADGLGRSRSSISHAVRALEARLGVRLLNRTTRSVSPTEAGTRLLERVSPLLRELDDALGATQLEAGPVRGTLRINCSEPAARVLLRGPVPEFLDRHPRVEFDLVVEGRLVDIVADGFDAGVRLGDAVPGDMVAVPIDDGIRFIPVASPAYLDRHGAPASPPDLKRHACIRQRLPSGKRYRWEFQRHGEEQAIDVPGALTLDNTTLMVQAAAQGLGIAYVPEPSARAAIARGQLVPVLLDWCPAIPGPCLYFPANRHMPAPLRAFVDLLRARAGVTPPSPPKP